jgi:hypothetical protein
VLAGAAFFVLPRSPVPEAPPKEHDVETPPSRVFRQPEQQQRFIAAVSQGKQEAISMLEQALAQAKRRGDADPEYVADLEQRLADQRRELAETLHRTRGPAVTAGE